MKTCPCKDCQDRTLTCHGFCDRYKAWRDELEKTKEWLREHRPQTSERATIRFFEKIRRRAKGYDRKGDGMRGE